MLLVLCLGTFVLALLLSSLFFMGRVTPRSLSPVDETSDRSPEKEKQKLASRGSFAAGSYEFEVEPSCLESINDEDEGAPKTVVKETILKATKTVYLIRHAESNENRRLASLSRSLSQLGRLSLPKKEDVAASVELLDVAAQIDSDVSAIGWKQINQVGSQLLKDKFLTEKGIRLVAHSPLKRARQTSEGMLGCVTPRTANGNSKDDYSHPGKKAEGVARVVELPFLAERTPIEWLPVNHDAFTKRIADFENWLGEQPEDAIAVVGHSQYFKSMLGLSYKFGNCDVWQLKFDPTVSLSPSIVKADVRAKERPKLDMAKVARKSFQSLRIKENLSNDLQEEKKEDVARAPSPGPKYDASDEVEDLARGWSGLKNLYRYQEELEDLSVPKT